MRPWFWLFNTSVRIGAIWRASRYMLFFWHVFKRHCHSEFMKWIFHLSKPLGATCHVNLSLPWSSRLIESSVPIQHQVDVVYNAVFRLAAGSLLAPTKWGSCRVPNELLANESSQHFLELTTWRNGSSQCSRSNFSGRGKRIDIKNFSSYLLSSACLPLGNDFFWCRLCKRLDSVKLNATPFKVFKASDCDTWCLTCWCISWYVLDETWLREIQYWATGNWRALERGCCAAQFFLKTAGGYSGYQERCLLGCENELSELSLWCECWELLVQHESWEPCDELVALKKGDDFWWLLFRLSISALLPATSVLFWKTLTF